MITLGMTWRSLRSRLCGATFGLSLVAAAGLSAADSAVPSFYVRAVTGPLAGKSVCYVCRNGDRPVVLVVLRELGPEAAALLKELDQVVNRRRADGLRCFVVLLSSQPQRDLGRLQTLAFDEKLAIPLTLAHESVLKGSSLDVETEIMISVVTYQDQRLVQRLGFRAGECTHARRQDIVSRAEQLGRLRD